MRGRIKERQIEIGGDLVSSHDSRRKTRQLRGFKAFGFQFDLRYLSMLKAVAPVARDWAEILEIYSM